MASSQNTTLTSLVITGLLSVAGAVTLTGAFTGTTITTSGNVTTAGTVFQSGGLLPVSGTLTQTNRTLGTGTGWSIQNPYSEAVRCKSLEVRVTTSANPTTEVDISRGTGALAAGTTTGTTLWSDLSLSTTRLNVSTGSLLYRQLSISTANIGAGTFTGSILYPIDFILDEAGGTNDYLAFDASASSGSGKTVVAEYHLECYSVD